jgi:hypothetical protein
MEQNREPSQEEINVGLNCKWLTWITEKYNWKEEIRSSVKIKTPKEIC